MKIKISRRIFSRRIAVILTGLIVAVLLISSTILILLDDRNELAEKDEVAVLTEQQFKKASTFNTAAIAKYNTSDNCWVIYQESVYDITTILDDLNDLPASSCGTEVTELSSESISKIAPYIVSSLVR